MDAITLLRTASVLLLLTMLGGIKIAFGKYVGIASASSWIALAHGVLAVFSVTLLAHAGLADRVHCGAMISLVLILAAAVGGIAIYLWHHLSGNILPSWFLAIHISQSVMGMLLVALSAFNF